jgi:hypothetical protein
MANTGSRLVELQLRAARGLGGAAEIMETDRLADRSLPAEDRARIEGALSGILGQAASVPAEYLAPDGHRSPTVEMPGHNPRNPEHQRFHSEWTAYHESERNFLVDNHDAAERLKNAQLPRPIIMFAIQNRNPQLLYFLAHRKNREYAQQLAQLPAHALQEKLEKLAEILLYDKRIPEEERGVIRAGDLSTDRYLKNRHGGKSIPEARKQLPRSREDLDADDYISMRQGEKREYRRVRGHR